MKVVQKNAKIINMPFIHWFAHFILWDGIVLHITPNSNIWNVRDII